MRQQSRTLPAASATSSKSGAVSYTHLDVYKRQAIRSSLSIGRVTRRSTVTCSKFWRSPARQSRAARSSAAWVAREIRQGRMCTSKCAATAHSSIRRGYWDSKIKKSRLTARKRGKGPSGGLLPLLHQTDRVLFWMPSIFFGCFSQPTD